MNLTKIFCLFTLILSFNTAAYANTSDGNWVFTVDSKKFNIKLKEHSYPSDMAPISGSITTPEGESYQIIKCTEQQMASSSQAYLYYLGVEFDPTCSYISNYELNAQQIESFIVLRTKLKYIWVFKMLWNSKRPVSGAIFDNSTKKKVADIKGYRL